MIPDTPGEETLSGSGSSHWMRGQLQYSSRCVSATLDSSPHTGAMRFYLLVELVSDGELGAVSLSLSSMWQARYAHAPSLSGRSSRSLSAPVQG